MAGPKRWPWKNQRDTSKSYSVTFLVHWAFGAVITWPLAVLVGRRMKVTQGGVPQYPLQKYVPDFINVEPAHLARKKFNKGFYGTMFVGGLLFAFTTMNQRMLGDDWFNRPDLKPYPAMVPKETMSITERTMYEAHH